MQRLARALFASLGLFACGAFVPAFGMPLSCALGSDGHSHVVTLSRRSPIADSAIYELQLGSGSARRPLFGAGDPEDSRGMDVRAQCVRTGKGNGNGTRALVVMGEFMSAGYPRGFVITHAPQGGRFERFDFAERHAPRWLYLGPKDTLLVFPPGGRAETRERYLVYRFVNGLGPGGDEETLGKPPGTRGYERIRIQLAPVKPVKPVKPVMPLKH